MSTDERKLIEVGDDDIDEGLLATLKNNYVAVLIGVIVLIVIVFLVWPSAEYFGGENSFIWLAVLAGGVGLYILTRGEDDCYL